MSQVSNLLPVGWLLVFLSLAALTAAAAGSTSTIINRAEPVVCLSLCLSLRQNLPANLPSQIGGTVELGWDPQNNFMDKLVYESHFLQIDITLW